MPIILWMIGNTHPQVGSIHFKITFHNIQKNVESLSNMILLEYLWSLRIIVLKSLAASQTIKSVGNIPKCPALENQSITTIINVFPWDASRLTTKSIDISLQTWGGGSKVVICKGSLGMYFCLLKNLTFWDKICNVLPHGLPCYISTCYMSWQALHVPQ